MDSKWGKYSNLMFRRYVTAADILLLRWNRRRFDIFTLWAAQWKKNEKTIRSRNCNTASFTFFFFPKSFRGIWKRWGRNIRRELWWWLRSFFCVCVCSESSRRRPDKRPAASTHAGVISFYWCHGKERGGTRSLPLFLPPILFFRNFDVWEKR